MTTLTDPATVTYSKGPDSLSPIPLVYFKPKGFDNLGDFLGRYIVEKMSGRPTCAGNPEVHKDILLTVGSIIVSRLPDGCTFWGSGFISARGTPNPANRFLAVRGPMTLARLRACGVEPPRAIGDPALLLPLLYRPKPSTRKYRLGVIPHYVDLGQFLQRARSSILARKDDVAVMKIATANVEGFIDVLTQCEMVVSSSLHGVILAQAYGIPALWVQFSHGVIGGGFKFRDYFLSVSIGPYEGPMMDVGPIDLDRLQVVAQSNLHLMRINNFDPRPLLMTCPFIDQGRRTALMAADGLPWTMPT